MQKTIKIISNFDDNTVAKQLAKATRKASTTNRNYLSPQQTNHQQQIKKEIFAEIVQTINLDGSIATKQVDQISKPDEQ